MLTGLRGVGKTVLLHEFRDIAAGHGWVCQGLEAGEDSPFVRQIAAVAQGALLDLTPRRRLSQIASRVLGVLKSFQVSWDIPAAGTLTVGVDPFDGRADSGILQRDLADLLRRRWHSTPRIDARVWWSRSTRSSICPISICGR